jgi:hypothetical protein
VWLLKKLQWRRYEGQIAIRALILGGMAAFFLDMLRQPFESVGSAWLDPSQWVALIAVAAGFGMLKLLYQPLPPPTREEVADILDALAEKRAEPYAHEIIWFAKFTDPLLIKVKEELSYMDDPKMTEADWERMREYARQIREASNEMKEQT